ncbi:DUF397 domain-containing protein [Actinomadura sp. WMMB 499]|uniref:DUF397 domain-containing protein n=1 Tax=Actinomadura sp. WMMB 499 TaxID=1219491 RepID=UPI001248F8F4|nr:DUF397 domain-containing protein [Actinomadura sp. WMMB 499]QFG20984.1 DUF397 domain-containing protein [Actinomadura sp. WMMB 499]
MYRSPASATSLTWRKSSHTQANGQCVELATTPGACLVRDSKDPDGPTLTVSPSAWSTLLTAIKTGTHNIR